MAQANQMMAQMAQASAQATQAMANGVDAYGAPLTRQLRSGDAVIRSGQSLFENAAGRAISQTGRN